MAYLKPGIAFEAPEFKVKNPLGNFKPATPDQLAQALRESLAPYLGSLALPEVKDQIRRRLEQFVDFAKSSGNLPPGVKISDVAITSDGKMTFDIEMPPAPWARVAVQLDHADKADVVEDIVKKISNLTRDKGDWKF